MLQLLAQRQRAATLLTASLKLVQCALFEQAGHAVDQGAADFPRAGYRALAHCGWEHDGGEGHQTFWGGACIEEVDQCRSVRAHNSWARVTPSIANQSSGSKNYSTPAIEEEKVDVVVIGAGVVGLAIARLLALSGREVLVLEADAAFGTGTSSRNSEVIHAGLYYQVGSLKVRGKESRCQQYIPASPLHFVSRSQGMAVSLARIDHSIESYPRRMMGACTNTSILLCGVCSLTATQWSPSTAFKMGDTMHQYRLSACLKWV